MKVDSQIYLKKQLFFLILSHISFTLAIKAAGGVADCKAISIGGQQHGSVFLG